MIRGGGLIVGIDLGTTNSAVAIWRDGAATLIPNSLGHLLTPSAVSVEDSGEILVGLAARERQVSHPDRTASAFKRYMGTQRRTQLGAVSFTPEELSAVVLRALKADAEAFLGEAVTEAVIAVPAYFNDKQRKATRRAGELAGLKVERLINEPTAAALAYGIADRERETSFLVFDLGGGTFDVSILEVFEGVLEVRASSGDNRLGGEDFNSILVDHVRGQMARRWGEATSGAAFEQRIRSAAERTRRALSENTEAELTVTWAGDRETVSITSETFERLADGLLNRLRQPVLRALADGRLRLEQLDEIVLVGGATRMPIVRRAVTRMFGRFPSNAVDPDEAVVRGAAIQAGLKSRDEALREVVLTDVCPYSLGVEVSDRLQNGSLRAGLFEPIIERNTTIPASRMKTFSTLQDGQRVLDMRIFQGESRLVVDNVLLGELRVQVPPRPAGEVAIECRFTYDIDGLLEVDVHVPASGERYSALIADEETVSAHDFAERRMRLAELKIHPRDADANRAALARASRCYEEALGDTRQFVASLITHFEGALATQDPKVIALSRIELLQHLDAIDGQTYL